MTLKRQNTYVSGPRRDKRLERALRRRAAKIEEMVASIGAPETVRVLSAKHGRDERVASWADVDAARPVVFAATMLLAAEPPLVRALTVWDVLRRAGLPAHVELGIPTVTATVFVGRAVVHPLGDASHFTAAG